MNAPVDRQQVVIKDIQMSFGSMVVFMVKWTIAAIPAFLILLLLGTVGAGLIRGALFGGFGRAPSSVEADRSDAAPPLSDAELADQAKLRRDADLSSAAFEMCKDSARTRLALPSTQHVSRAQPPSQLPEGTSLVNGEFAIPKNGAMTSIPFECQVMRSGERIRILRVGTSK